MRLLSVIHNPVFGGGGNQMVRLREPLERRGVTTLGAVTDEPGTILPRLRAGGVEVVELRLHRLRATPTRASSCRSWPGSRRRCGRCGG